MKKVLKYLTMLCLTVIVGIMVSSVDVKAARANGPTSTTVNAYTNYPTFYVHTDSNWSVDTSASFITALNPTGTAGDAMIVLKIDSNPSGASRSGTVVVHDAYGAVSISIYQEGKSYFKIVESPFTNGSATVEITRVVGAGSRFEEGQLKYVCESNKNVSVFLDGKKVEPIRKVSVGNGGTRYEYKLTFSKFEFAEHSFEVRVDGNNIEGGKYHSYTICTRFNLIMVARRYDELRF